MTCLAIPLRLPPSAWRERGEFEFMLGSAHPHQFAHYQGDAFVALPCLLSRTSKVTGEWSLPAEPGPLVRRVGIDSGGFTVLRVRPWWSVAEHARHMRRARQWVGARRLAFCVVQDWICAPDILARTGLAVAEHVRRTAQSWADLLAIAPDLPWAPVLQGVTRADYLRCADECEQRARRSLRSAPAVLLGSIAARCLRRDGTAEPWIVDLAAEFVERGYVLHALGAKDAALREFARVGCASGDSLDWSGRGRRDKRALAQWLGLPDFKHPPAPQVLLALAEAEVASGRAPAVGSTAGRSLRALRVSGGKCPASSVAWAEAWRQEQLAFVRAGLAARSAGLALAA